MTWARAFVVLAAAGVMWLPASGMADENLLRNGGFEETFGQKGVPQGWAVYRAGAPMTKLAPARPGRTGKQALLISDHNPAEEVGIFQTVPLPPGARMLIASVWARPAPGGKGVGGFLQLRFLPSNRYFQMPLRGAGNGWRKCQVAGQVPKGTESIVVYLYTHRETVCDTLVDDAKVVAVNSPEKLLAESQAVDLSAFPPPPIDKLKPLYLQTVLVRDGRPAASIVAPGDGRYAALAKRIQEAIARSTAAVLPIKADEEVRLPFDQNLIILGNRSTNDLIRRLYDLYYTYLDLKYPGPGGYVVRSLHNPFGNGRNAIFVGASDDEGMSRAVDEFIRIAAAAVKGRSLSLGWTMKIRLGRGLRPPEDADEVGSWSDSMMYPPATYFGWNSLSRRLALYYMTGDEKWLREFMWLAFPDEAAKKYMWKVDGERIEDKDHPLAGPYHYNGHHMILLWDLVEESPFFTDEQRLRITREFAQQLRHWQHEWCYTGRYYGNPPAGIGSRHDQWAAVNLFCLSRYFDTYYPNIVWRKNKEAVEQYFGRFAKTFYVAGELDHLWWYTTSYEPLMAYIILSGDRRGVENGNLEKLLRGYDILLQHRRGGPYLRQLSLSFAHMATYLTGDGRFLWYRDMTGLKTDIFRIGQSFWPQIKPRPPEEIVGAALVRPVPAEEARARVPRVPLEQAFEFAGWRAALGPKADYMLLDGLDSGSRNPYHCLVLTHLRHGAHMVLDGYLNQVVVRRGGLVEPKVPFGAALIKHVGFRSAAYFEAEVPGFFFGRWRRRIFHYAGHWTLVVDTFTPREDADNLDISVQWWVGGRARRDGDGRVRVHLGDASAVLVPWEKLPVSIYGRVVRFSKVVNARKGRSVAVATLIGVELDGRSLDCLKGDDTHVVIRDGGRAFVATWSNSQPGLRICGDGLALFSTSRQPWGAGAEFAIEGQQPVDVLWDGERHTVELACPADTAVTLPVADGARPMVDGRTPLRAGLRLSAGKHVITGAPMPAEVMSECSSRARKWLAAASRPDVRPPSPAGLDAPQLTARLQVSVGEPVTRLLHGPGGSGPMVYAVGGKHLFPIGRWGLGQAVSLPAAITAAAFWPEEKLVLVGCKNDKVYAYRADGSLAWTFTSEMAPEVFRTGKTYWFKSALPGISGLATGSLTGQGTQAFVGSACTIEVLDASGKLIKRLPQYWGSVWRMAIVKAGDGTRKLLAAKMPNGVNNIGIIDGRTWKISYGFTGLPPGHSIIPGWSSMNTPDLLVADLDGDGAEEVVLDVNGSWNRVTVYRADGKPLWSQSFGPSMKYPHRHMRGLAVADLDGNGGKEVVAADETGIVTAFDATGLRLWTIRLAEPPTTLATIHTGSHDLVAVGTNGGGVYLVGAGGRVIARAGLQGAVTALLAGEQRAVWAGTSRGLVALLEPPR